MSNRSLLAANLIGARSIILCLLAAHVITFALAVPVEKSEAARPQTNGRKELRQKLDQVLRTYDFIKLDTASAVRQVKETGHLSLFTSNGVMDFVLKPHDLRSKSYRAQKVGSNGQTASVAFESQRIFKGKLANDDSSHARFTLDESSVEGLIFDAGAWLQLQPAKRFSADADRDDYVLFNATELVQSMKGFCPAGIMAERKNIASATNLSASVFAPFRVIDLATEADAEYVQSLGGAQNAINEILSIMNQVEGVYEVELGITFRIVFQNVWDTAADPYTTTTDSIQVWSEFASYWNTHFTGVERTMAHMWTGKDLGGVLGRAAQSVACITPSWSYGFSRIDDHIPLKFITPAHEIAHTLGATHADGVFECVGSIMNVTTTSGLTFCQFSRNEITQFVNQFGQCLATAATHSIRGTVRDIGGRPISEVNVSLSGSQSSITQTDTTGFYSFSNLVRGGDYRVAVSKSGYMFSPAEIALDSLDGDREANFTATTSPGGPVLAAELGSNQAIALDSVTFVREPFPINAFLNFTADRRTRVLLFAANVVLLPGESISDLTAVAEDSLGNFHPLVIESAEKLPTLQWLTQVAIKLPAEVCDGSSILVTLKFRGVVSNAVVLRLNRCP